MRRSLPVLMMLTALGTASGAVWYVDDSVYASGNGTSLLQAFKTVQEGIDAASHGDTVIVAEGIYNESIQFRGTSITLTSTNPDSTSVRNATIIDGYYADSVVRFSGAEDESCVLSGFTIRNGDASRGGGIYGNATLATIEKNLITGNHGVYGGGLFFCAGKIRLNTIIGNVATYYGGGITSCSGLIQENTISGNLAGGGGGLAFCHGEVNANRIANNNAAVGGGLYHCNGQILNNEIVGNTAEQGGGLADCDARISGNLVQANMAKGVDSQGGGLFECGSTIIWNTIQGNSSEGMGGGLYGCHGDIQRSTIRDNMADERGGGLSLCNGSIESNRIFGNSADHGGGLNDCGGAIRNNIIVGNFASGDLASGGGGLLNCSGMIENNTILMNTARRGGGLYVCDGVIRNCIIWANTAPDFGPQLYLCNTPRYSCIQGWTGGGLGNTALAPIFVDPDGPDNNPATYADNNYRLSWSPMIPSSCIDEGENQPWMQGTTDRDGNPRVFYGLSSNTVDIGAYEYGSWPFKIVSVQQNAAGETHLIWYSRPGDTYVVWSKPVLYSSGPYQVIWKEEVTRTSQGAISSWTDPGSALRRKFYRVELKL